MRRMSIKVRLVGALVSGVALVAGANWGLMQYVANRNVQSAAQQAVRSAADAYATLEKDDVDKLSTALEVIVAHPEIQAAFEARNREWLLALTAPIFERLKKDHDITHWYFHEPAPARTCFLRVHKPALHGDVVNRVTFSQAIASQAQGAGKELGKTAFALRVVRPLQIGGRLAGYVELGEEIDHFLARMKVHTGDEYALAIDKKFLDRQAWSESRHGQRDNWDDRPDAVVVNSTAEEDRFTGFASAIDAIPAGGVLLDEVRRDEKTWARGIAPVSDAAGRQVGALLVLRDITALHEAMVGERYGLLLLLVLLAGGMSLLLVFLLEELVFVRLSSLIVTLEDLSVRLAGGDYHVVAELKPKTRDDEIGRFEEFFAGFLRVVADALRELDRRSKRTA